MNMDLFHFTCDDHGAPGIDKTGLIQPNQKAVWAPVAWFTADPMASPESIGLGTRVLATCDRMAVRYRITQTRHCRPWGEFRTSVDPGWVAALEAAPGVLPETWWVSLVALPTRIKWRVAL